MPPDPKNEPLRKEYTSTMHDYTTKKGIRQDLEKRSADKRMQKHINAILAEHLIKTKQARKAERVKECSNSLSFKVWRDAEQTAKLHTINLCRERLCANCATALARQKFGELNFAFAGESGIYHIILTVDNCPGRELRQTLSKMQKAFKAFMRKLDTSFYYRSYEVTHNKEEDTYHPHIHTLVKLAKLISRKKATELWSECIHKAGIRTKYAYCQVCVKKVKDADAYFELCKYVTKPTDLTPETVKVLEPAVKGLQLKRGSAEVTEKLKEYRHLNEAERKAKEAELDKYGWDIELYIWQDDKYNKA